MMKVLLALSGFAVAVTAAPAALQAKDLPNVCLKWKDGVCVSTHRVKGNDPYKMGYVFGPTYGYTTYDTLPQQAVSYYKLDDHSRYVYSDGYVYVVDPTTYAVTRVLDTFSH